MGQKVNPIAFRVGVTRGWASRWYASKQDFADLLVEDRKVRDFIKNHPKKTQYKNAGIDLSPAVRDFLGMKGTATVEWRFVDDHMVPDGPWLDWSGGLALPSF